jgi:hypothetical protein
MVDMTAKKKDINYYNTDQYISWDELWVYLDLP